MMHSPAYANRWVQLTELAPEVLLGFVVPRKFVILLKSVQEIRSATDARR